MIKNAGVAILSVLICDSACAKNTEVAAIVSRISSADSIIIAANLSQCNEADSTMNGVRCIVDLNRTKCKKFHSKCSELPSPDGSFPHTLIKIHTKADKISLGRFIKKQVSPPPKGASDGIIGCYSIEGSIFIYKNGSLLEFQYDSTNSFLNGIRMDYEFWGSLLKRYGQRNKSDEGC